MANIAKILAYYLIKTIIYKAMYISRIQLYIKTCLEIIMHLHLVIQIDLII